MGVMVLMFIPLMAPIPPMLVWKGSNSPVVTMNSVNGAWLAVAKGENQKHFKPNVDLGAVVLHT